MKKFSMYFSVISLAVFLGVFFINTDITQAVTAYIPPTINFTRDLKLGMSGNDVKALQQFLNANGFLIVKTGVGSPGKETTKFGALTKLALIKFQEKYRSEILTPQNLKKGTGNFYSFTRAFVNKLSSDTNVRSESIKDTSVAGASNPTTSFVVPPGYILTTAGLVKIQSSGSRHPTPVVTATPDPALSFVCGDNISFTYNGSLVTYGTVANAATGKCWLDRNLGATQVATSSTDYLAYGDLFQWGRPADGHQLINRTTGDSVNGTQFPTGRVLTTTPGTNTFIIQGDGEWSSVDNDGLTRSTYLAKTDGTGICPAGFRVPTDTELNTERASWSSQGPVGAFSSPLKFTAGGRRFADGGDIFNTGELGNYWSSVVLGNNSFYMYFYGGDAAVTNSDRAYGYAVRCIRAETTDTYAVNYDANGSTGGTKPADQIKTPDVTLVLATNSGNLVKTGYTFAGWNTLADGTGTNYAVGANYTANVGVTLFARWVPLAPAALSYDSPNLFIVNREVSTLSPAVTGSVDSYSISPVLSAGLDFDTSNGEISGTPTASTSQTTYTITATNAGGSTAFEVVIMVDGTVVGANSKVWLDRNLGATQVALSSTDSSAYGDLYQWGRPADGHQVRTSLTASGQVANVAPGTNTFIIPSGDWSTVDSNGALRSAYFAKTDGTGICPSGFRVPTNAEFDAERLSWSSNNSAGAFASPLKLTVAGTRTYNNGSFSNVGVNGYYWSNNIDETYSGDLYLASVTAAVSRGSRANGLAVRCILNTVTYDANGSTGGTKPADQIKTPDVTLVLATNSGNLVKTGYTFAGWNTSADGSGTTYAAGADYTADTGVTLYAKWTALLAVGDTYGGGKVAYILQSGDPGYDAEVQHGLIAATTSQSTGKIWHASNTGTTGATGTAIGTGLSNTNAIIALYGAESNAATLARNYNGGGYNDWYLPSRDELNKLSYSALANSVFTNNFYWSSSEINASLVWIQFFLTNAQDGGNKNATYYVHAVRSF